MKLGDNNDVLDREVPPLAAAARYFGIRETLVVTMGEERVVENNGISVRILPAWRWMAQG